MNISEMQIEVERQLEIKKRFNRSIAITHERINAVIDMVCRDMKTMRPHKVDFFNKVGDLLDRQYVYKENVIDNGN